MKLLEQTIDEITQYGEKKGKSAEEILRLLHTIQYAYYNHEYLPEDLHYPDPPVHDPKKILKTVQANFPKHGKYAVIDIKDTGIGKGKKEIYNIHEDLSALILELLDISYYIKKTSKRYALLCFKKSYEKKLQVLISRIVHYFVNM